MHQAPWPFRIYCLLQRLVTECACEGIPSAYGFTCQGKHRERGLQGTRARARQKRRIIHPRAGLQGSMHADRLTAAATTRARNASGCHAWSLVPSVASYRYNSCSHRRPGTCQCADCRTAFIACTHTRQHLYSCMCHVQVQGLQGLFVFLLENLPRATHVQFPTTAPGPAQHACRHGFRSCTAAC